MLWQCNIIFSVLVTVHPSLVCWADLCDHHYGYLFSHHEPFADMLPLHFAIAILLMSIDSEFWSDKHITPIKQSDTINSVTGLCLCCVCPDTSVYHMNSHIWLTDWLLCRLLCVTLEGILSPTGKCSASLKLWTRELCCRHVPYVSTFTTIRIYNFVDNCSLQFCDILSFIKRQFTRMCWSAFTSMLSPGLEYFSCLATWLCCDSLKWYHT